MELNARERETLYFRYPGPPKDAPMCINCAYFLRHYIKGGPPMFVINYVPLESGHCLLHYSQKYRNGFDVCGSFQKKGEKR